MLLNVLVCDVSSWQSIVVSLNRSDYMFDRSDDGSASLKQIEINTFSVAGFGETDRLPEVHRYGDRYYPGPSYVTVYIKFPWKRTVWRHLDLSRNRRVEPKHTQVNYNHIERFLHDAAFWDTWQWSFVSFSCLGISATKTKTDAVRFQFAEIACDQTAIITLIFQTNTVVSGSRCGERAHRGRQGNLWDVWRSCQSLGTLRPGEVGRSSSSLRNTIGI